MTSYLIISEDHTKLETYIQNFCQEKGIDPVDITIIERDTSAKRPALSIGIDTVKRMQEKLYYRPIKSAHKITIIRESQYLTTEAQNALLKVLEEPPINTYILLLSDNRYALLPTILSRCKIIDLTTEKKVSEEEEVHYKELTLLCKNMTISQALAFAEKMASSKDEALVSLEKFLLSSRKQLFELETEKSSEQLFLATLMTKIHETYSLIKTTNVNLRFALEIFFLQFVAL